LNGRLSCADTKNVISKPRRGVNSCRLIKYLLSVMGK
jgi:hypothetical protein